MGRPAPALALLNEATGSRPAPAFVEWLMGLEAGWVTEARHGLSPNQQLRASETECSRARQSSHSAICSRN